MVQRQRGAELRIGDDGLTRAAEPWKIGSSWIDCFGHEV